MNELKKLFGPVYHGMAMGVLALILGALWAAYMATHHETLHGAFESQLAQASSGQRVQDMDGVSMGHTHAEAGQHAAEGGHAHQAGGQHSHSGNLAQDAMQRLLRGHIHYMGIGLLSVVMLLMVATTSLRSCWKKLLGWTFGLGALLYPPAWILMGVRTVELGPQAAEASVLWLFGPAVGLLIGSLLALFAVLAIEWLGFSGRRLLRWAFEQ